MKFQLIFKTPDVLVEVEDIEDEKEREQARMLTHEYMRYDEYITIEFDTENKTAIVVKN